MRDNTQCLEWQMNRQQHQITDGSYAKDARVLLLPFSAADNMYSGLLRCAHTQHCFARLSRIDHTADLQKRQVLGASKSMTDINVTKVILWSAVIIAAVDTCIESTPATSLQSSPLTSTISGVSKKKKKRATIDVSAKTSLTRSPCRTVSIKQGTHYKECTDNVQNFPSPSTSTLAVLMQYSTEGCVQRTRVAYLPT